MASRRSASSLLFLGLVFAIACRRRVASAASFNETVDITWGGHRARMLNNGSLLTLSEDRQSGSGFQSKNRFLFGKINMQIKLVPGNSAGTVTSFYMSSEGPSWDEIDFEFLGNLSGQPYTVHTNIYINGNGNREQQFHLSFDPTADFHNYTILWNQNTVGWYVDGKAIRVFPNREADGVPYPNIQPMRMISSIWNGEDWATMGGRVKTNWTNAPFTATFCNYNPSACVITADGASSCANVTRRSIPWYWVKADANTRRHVLSAKRNNMIYDYCADTRRFPAGLPPECTAPS